METALMVCFYGKAAVPRLLCSLRRACRSLAAAASVLAVLGAPRTQSATFEDYSSDPPRSVLLTDEATTRAPSLDFEAVVPGSEATEGMPLNDNNAGGQAAVTEFPDKGETSYDISDISDNRVAGVVMPAVPPGLLQRWQENRTNCWVLRTEAIALWRNAPASRPLFTSYDEASQTTGPTVLNANQLESDALAAPRVTLSRLDKCGRGIEASYLYAGNFYATNSLPFLDNGYAVAQPGIYGNVWGVDNTPVSAVQQSLTANLNSAEINFREPIGWGSTRFLAGFRWLQWYESWSMTDQFSDPADPTVTGVDNYSTRCVNNLYGGQIGLDSVLWNTGSGLRLESLVKAGAYYNAASQYSAYSYSTNVGFGFDRAVFVGGPGSASFVGEVGLTAVVPLRRNLDLRCGYFGLWLDSIAQPTNQLSGQTLTQVGDPAGTLSSNGGVVLQGVSLGLEGRW